MSASLAAAQHPFRTHTDRFEPRRVSTRAEWEARSTYIREHVLASAGLLPMPARTPLNAVVFAETTHADYVVAKVYFESLPGFYVTGNLYRPIGDGRFPAVLSPHGHWPYGRLENTAVTSGPGRAIGLARQGFVVFSHDMIGYNDSRQVPHTFGGRREALWGLSLSGLQLWNSIRALDFLETLPYVRRSGFGVTGESGGGTQTFLLAAVDERVAVAAPVNMISLHMQGGCICENPPGLRLDLTNVDIAAAMAPRPLLMVSATGDWTSETLEREYPAVRSIYALFDAASNVHAVRMNAEHNYNKDSREAMYAWMARWLQQAPADARRTERSFTVDPLTDLLVFYQRPLPPGALTTAQVTEQWVTAAQAQIAERRATATVDRVLDAAMRHALGFGEGLPAQAPSAPAVRRIVLVAGNTAPVEGTLREAGFDVQRIAFTPFDRAAAEQVRHFDTYNRTAASQQVADIVAALSTSPSAALIAAEDAGPAALLALALVPGRRAVVDIGGFDASSDAAFLEQLYIPGLRRAGDFQTAVSMARGEIVIHNAGERFTVNGARIVRDRLAPAAVAAAIGR